MELGEYRAAGEYLSEALKTARDSNQIPFLLSALTIAAALLAPRQTIPNGRQRCSKDRAGSPRHHLPDGLAPLMMSRLETPDRPRHPSDLPCQPDREGGSGVSNT